MRPVPVGMPLSNEAREVLGTVVACPWTGPHRAPSLRRWTRLTPGDFEAGLAELAATGLVHRLDGELFWLTERAEQTAAALFGP